MKSFLSIRPQSPSTVTWRLLRLKGSLNSINWLKTGAVVFLAGDVLAFEWQTFPSIKYTFT